MIPDRELPSNLPGQERTGHRLEGVRVMAFNALDQEARRRLLRRGEMDTYLDEMAESVEAQALTYQDRTLGYDYEERRAWQLAIRLVIHGREPD